MPRKAMTKEAKIKRALERGLSASEIARMYRTSPQYVNLIKRKQLGKQTHQEHIVGPLPGPEKVEPMFATGIVALQPVPETSQPTAGILAVPPAEGKVSGLVVTTQELVGPPRPTMWQRFKMWAWGRA